MAGTTQSAGSAGHRTLESPLEHTTPRRKPLTTVIRGPQLSDRPTSHWRVRACD